MTEVRYDIGEHNVLRLAAELHKQGCLVDWSGGLPYAPTVKPYRYDPLAGQWVFKDLGVVSNLSGRRHASHD
jgi:hypothetical protein